MKQAGAHTRWKLYAAAFAAPVLLLAAVYAACLLYTSDAADE